MKSLLCKKTGLKYLALAALFSSLSMTSQATPISQLGSLSETFTEACNRIDEISSTVPTGDTPFADQINDLVPNNPNMEISFAPACPVPEPGTGIAVLLGLGFIAFQKYGAKKNKQL